MLLCISSKNQTKHKLGVTCYRCRSDSRGTVVRYQGRMCLPLTCIHTCHHDSDVQHLISPATLYRPGLKLWSCSVPRLFKQSFVSCLWWAHTVGTRPEINRNTGTGFTGMFGAFYSVSVYSVSVLYFCVCVGGFMPPAPPGQVIQLQTLNVPLLLSCL